MTSGADYEPSRVVCLVAGVLVGTHAHEVMSVMAQLMSCWDQKVDAAGDGPVAVSALLAHLLFLAVNGGLESATALADTFGTKAFLSAALVTRIPEEFIEDIQANKASVSVPEGGPPEKEASSNICYQ